MSHAPICQMPLYVRRPYCICQMPLFVRCPNLSDAPICQIPLYVRCPYLSDAPICQMFQYVRSSKGNPTWSFHTVGTVNFCETFTQMS